VFVHPDKGKKSPEYKLGGKRASGGENAMNGKRERVKVRQKGTQVRRYTLQLQDVSRFKKERTCYQFHGCGTGAWRKKGEDKKSKTNVKKIRLGKQKSLDITRLCDGKSH